jgi:hypothetical protein
MEVHQDIAEGENPEDEEAVVSFQEIGQWDHEISTEKRFEVRHSNLPSMMRQINQKEV